MTEAASGFILPVDKAEGPTSHDLVQRARRALGERRVGHTGTLDPFASGLLLLCVGRATRIAEYLTGLDKTYVAIARLGQRTDSDDREGRVIEECAGWVDLTPERIIEVLERFRGPLRQVPPEFSAKKVGGVRTYERARRGETVLLDPVGVEVYDLEVLECTLPLVRFSVHCSSGTYIRALARDLGQQLGVGGHLVGLRRTAIGRFRVEDALGEEELNDLDRVRAAAISPLDALAHLPEVSVDEAALRRLAQGQAVAVAGTTREETVAVSWGQELVAVGAMEGGVLHPRKVFVG